MLQRTLAACLLVFLLGACRDGVVEPVESDLWISGVIMEIDADDVKRVLIEERKPDAEPSDDAYRVWFSVSDATVILRETESGLTRAYRHNIKRGRRASAVTHGDVLYSDPPQASADSLILRY